MPKKLKMREVSEAARVGPETIRRWVKKGLFPAPVKVGGTILFDACEVETALRITAKNN
jgi:predicted DNA-binding transcriptional regulator AlpA